MNLLLTQCNYTHVYPIDDWFPHWLEGTTCRCNPEVDANIVVHNSFDGREWTEEDRKERYDYI